MTRDIETTIEVRCAHSGCPDSVGVWRKHLDNLTANPWRCAAHRDQAPPQEVPC